MPSISLGRFHFWMGMVALVARWFSLLDVAKTAFFAPFSSPTSQFLDFFHSFFCINPPCLELNVKHKFVEIPLLDGYGCPGCLVVFLARCGKNCSSASTGPWFLLTATMSYYYGFTLSYLSWSRHWSPLLVGLQPTHPYQILRPP